MADALGTRTRQNFETGRNAQGSETRSNTRDPGKTKRVVTSATFTASNGRVTGSNGDFTNFKVEDAVLIEGTLLNNGFFSIIGLDGVNAAYLTLDPAPKDEGPIANTTVQTP